MFTALVKTMRPRQWPKNIFLFAALVFDKQLFVVDAFLRTLAGFALFCLISSAVYIFNDLADIEADRRHPQKKNRPIPSGQLSVGAAWVAGILLVAITFGLGYLLAPAGRDIWLWPPIPGITTGLGFRAPAFVSVMGLYFLINMAYSKWLKHVPILDVLIISAGFVLRVAAGVTLIHVVRFSPWLYVVMTLLSLFLGFGKRRAELSLLAHGAGSHRKVLEGYTIPLLDQYIMIVSGTTIVAYSLYTFSAPNVPANHSMMLTIPFVVYTIFRYLYLIHIEEKGGEPEEILLSDRPFQIAMVLWALTVLVVFYLS